MIPRLSCTPRWLPSQLANYCKFKFKREKLKKRLKKKKDSQRITITRLALYAWSMSTLKCHFDSLGSRKCQCDLSPSNTL